MAWTCSAPVGEIERIIVGGGFLSRQKAGYIKAIMEKVEGDAGKPSLDHLRTLSPEEAENCPLRRCLVSVLRQPDAS